MKTLLVNKFTPFQQPSPNTSSPVAGPSSVRADVSADLDNIARCDSDSSLDETDIDLLVDAENDKDVFRTKAVLHVRDLARKSPRVLAKKSDLYRWNLITVAIFYALPVIQLMLTFQVI